MKTNAEKKNDNTERQVKLEKREDDASPKKTNPAVCKVPGGLSTGQ